MLQHLLIRNYALIRHLEISPSDSLNVITGETGAGKSIMLGALGLLLGNRADTKVLWDEQEKCITEGTFNLKGLKLKKLFSELELDYEEQTIIRREINPGGKSRAFINDTPVTLDVLRQIGNRLMDIHSQHETLELGNQGFQLRLIDLFGGHSSLADEYEKHWFGFQANKQELERLQQEAGQLKAEADYVNFQLDELAKANLQAGEQGKQEGELKILEHAEEIKQRLTSAFARLDDSEVSIKSMLGEIRTDLQAISGYAEAYQKLFDRFNSLRLELQDIGSEIEQLNDAVEFDPERYELVQNRLSLIYQLQQKHRLSSVDELLALQQALEQKANTTRNLDELLRQAQAAKDQSEKELLKAGEHLSKSRQQVLKPLASKLVTLLRQLGMPDACIEFDYQSISPVKSGLDRIEILFSANKGIAPRSLSEVASGGEFSRVMFAIKYVMAEKTALPTLVLDEIDTGVSGEIALQLGNLMKSMSKGHQLIAISHLPQIAAKADTHFVVFKEQGGAKASTQIRLLGQEERIEEIAKMISGAKPTSTALESARELMTI